MSSTKFLLGDGSIFEPVDAKEAEKLRGMGLPEATDRDVHHEDLRQQYSSWAYAPKAAALGAVEFVAPGAVGTIASAVGAISPETGRAISETAEGVKAAHPNAYLGGGITGVVGGGLAGLGVKTASALGALGIGAAQGAAMAFDEVALKHLQTPEGAEKAAAEIGLGALIMGGASLLFHGAGKVVAEKLFGKAGKAIVESSEAKQVAKQVAASPLMSPGVQERLAKTGYADQAMAFAKDNDLFRRSESQLKAHLGVAAESATKDMNEVKSISSKILPEANYHNLEAALNQTLKGTGVEKSVSKFLSKDPTVKNMHQLRMHLDAKINYENKVSPFADALFDARELVDDFITQTVQHNTLASPAMAGGALETWGKANADYNMASVIQKALKFKDVVESPARGVLSELGGALGKTAIRAGVGALVGGVVGGGLAGAAAGAGLGILGGRASEAYSSGRMAQGLGKFMQGFDDKVIQTVANGLDKTGVSITAPGAATVATKFLGLTDYSQLSAMTQWSGENPGDAVPRMAEQLDTHGVPGPVVDAVMGQALKAHQYLQGELPKNPWAGKTVAPLEWQPGLTERALFMDKANAVNNPLWALANPTPSRMAAVQAVYPVLSQRVAELVAQRAAYRARLSRDARAWAAHVTGVPGSPMTFPGPTGQASPPSSSSGMPSSGTPSRPSPSPGKSAFVTSTQNQFNRMSE